MPESESDYQCKYQKCDLRNEPCLQCVVDYIKVELYKRIQNDNEGELSRDEFIVIIFDENAKHEEIDDEINRMSLTRAEQLVCEYGISNAIQLYIDTFGAIDRNAPETKSILYTICDEYLNDRITLSDYNKWCESNPL